MREIKIETWKSNVPVFTGEGKERKIVGTEQQDENLLIALNALLGTKRPEEMPRGLDHFRLFNRLNKAFTKAEQTKILKLEETEYKFLKDMVKSDVPSAWGMNNNLFKALDTFLEVKSDLKEEK